MVPYKGKRAEQAYFRFMCTLRKIDDAAHCMSAEELACKVERVNGVAGRPAFESSAAARAFVQGLYTEVTAKLLQTVKHAPAKVSYFTIPSVERCAFRICAVASVEGKDELYLFSDDCDFIAAYVRQNAPLVVW